MIRKEELVLEAAWDKTFCADDGGKNAIPFDKLTSFFTEYLR